MEERIRGNAKKIQWKEWSKEAFDLAKKLDKPVLLDLSAVWCHWCHVMDTTSYSDPEIIKRINEDYIPIRVDTDQRPDISERYNFGGYPTTAFLTPRGEVIVGGTYIPPETLKRVLKQVLDLHKKKGKEKPKAKRVEEPFKPQKVKLEESIIWNIAYYIASDFDNEFGGFGSESKFPSPDAIDLSLFMYGYTDNKGFLKIATKTLEGIIEGLEDKVEGGFYRYSVARNWKVPHYEKMLETNAGLIMNSLHLYDQTRDDIYRDSAERALEYVNKNLQDDLGGFYGSQDADEEYYKLSLEQRAPRASPHIDRTIYANWSAMMIITFLEAYSVLENEDYLRIAIKSIESLLGRCYRKGEGMYHYFDSKARIQDLLTDQVYTASCLIKASEVTGNNKYIQYALDIADYTIKTLGDASGGFFDKVFDPEEIGALRLQQKPLIENSVASECLVKLSQFTGREDYLSKAESTLSHLSAVYQKYGILASRYALAVLLFLQPVQIVIVGSKDSRRVKEFIQKSIKPYDPRKTIITLDPIMDQELISRLGYPTKGEAVAYVCAGKVCSQPILEPELVVKTIEEQSKRVSG